MSFVLWFAHVLLVIPSCLAQSLPSRLHPRNATASYRFYSNATARLFVFTDVLTTPLTAIIAFRVNALPDIPFAVGEFYSGLVPIDWSDPSRQLFFIFKPSTGPAVDEVTVWLNGGPGCSSLTGFLQENGPWLWQPGTEPLENAYAWASITNMLWVDQPVGTGFSVGEIRATSETDIADDFVSWYRNWQDLFGIRNFRIYLTGESYAGRYIPYIANAMYEQNDTACFNVSGALITDPTIGQYTRDSFSVPIAAFVNANNANLLNLNTSTINLINTLAEVCGYTDYLNHYLQFPPPVDPQPTGTFNIHSNPLCDIQALVVEAMYNINPCFSIYNIAQQCPLLTNILPLLPDRGKEAYFNHAAVKLALHAPMDVKWSVCALHPVFINPSNTSTATGPELNNDTSPDPIQSVLPRLIERTQRVLIGNGDWDLLLPTNGTLLAIANMTWGERRGFQAKPEKPLVIGTGDRQYAARFQQEGEEGLDGPQGTMGVWTFERGLTWTQIFQCGHMVPQFQPRVALRQLMWVLGRVDSISDA